MAAEISDITPDSSAITEREMLVSISAKLDQIDARLGDLETDLSGLVKAWTVGGLRGLREAARGLRGVY